MPIEIRELNIKVSVSQNQPEQGNEPPAGNAMPDKDEIISECVEQVMELLKLKNDR